MQRPLRNSRPTRPSATRSTLRRAFSLIELMVVMLIITILMGMLLAAVRGAMTRARVAAVVIEFKSIEKAIIDFKSKYGTEPPSGIVLYESSAGWGGSTAVVSRSRALVRQIWPDFDFSIPHDLNNNGTSTDTLTLNGAECLLFFLGGVVDNSNGTGRRVGFSYNGENPFSTGGARSGPFYEFDPSRLKDVDGDQMQEYLDSLPGQVNPILYGSSYSGRGYRDADLQFAPQPPYDKYSTLPTGFAWCYRRHTGGYPVESTAPPPIFSKLEPFNAKSIQLISPGMDGEYGWGGALSGDMELLDPRPERAVERDNITNFKGGTIN